jgi:integrase
LTVGRLFKQRITRYRLPDGKIVPKGTAGAKKSKEKSEKWYGEYRDAQGTLRRVALCKDKAAAQTKLYENETRAERQSVGRIDRYDEHGRCHLTRHVEDFEQQLVADGDTPAHVQQTISRLRAVFNGCGFTRLGDLSASRAATWLHAARQRPAVIAGPEGVAKKYGEIAAAFGVSVHAVGLWKRRGAPITQRTANDLGAIHRWRVEEGLVGEGIGIGTSNHYVRALKSFGNWLFSDERWPKNPFTQLEPLNVEVDVRRERRTLTADDFAQLVATAHKSEFSFRGLSGLDRELLYIVASTTGLRAAELASLTVASFDLDGVPPTVTVDAGYSKRRRRDELPLRTDVVDMLRPVLTLLQSGPGGRDTQLWPGGWVGRSAEMLRGDLAVAGIPYLDDAGCVFDFHAIRGLFVTALIEAGVNIKTVQKLARHSSEALTLDRYARVQGLNLAAAVEQLPRLPKPAPELTSDLQATGTDEPAPNFVTGYVTGNVTESDALPCPALSGDGVTTVLGELDGDATTLVSPRVSDSSCPTKSRGVRNRAARTRTGNQRIMSPLL